MKFKKYNKKNSFINEKMDKLWFKKKFILYIVIYWSFSINDLIIKEEKNFWAINLNSNIERAIIFLNLIR